MSSPASPRSPLYRRKLLSAVLTPLLCLAAYLSLATGGLMTVSIALTAASLLRQFIPYRPQFAPAAEALSEKTRNRDELLSIFSRFACILTGFWIFDQLQGFELLRHIQNDRILLTPELLTSSSLISLIFVLRNVLVLRSLSDEQIAAYHRGDGPIRFGPRRPVLPDKPPRPAAPTTPLPPRPDPY
ncbi:MAG: hypothetical protein JWO82_2674 [Akkermansiaceae bacterium]|nr:hypothetical protein [Akkermansiaceae bacterium]